VIFSILNNFPNFLNIGEPRTLPPSSSQAFESSNISINVPVFSFSSRNHSNLIIPGSSKP